MSENTNSGNGQGNAAVTEQPADDAERTADGFRIVSTSDSEADLIVWLQNGEITAQQFAEINAERTRQAVAQAEKRAARKNRGNGKLRVKLNSGGALHFVGGASRVAGFGLNIKFQSLAGIVGALPEVLTTTGLRELLENDVETVEKTRQKPVWEKDANGIIVKEKDGKTKVQKLDKNGEKLFEDEIYSVQLHGGVKVDDELYLDDLAFLEAVAGFVREYDANRDASTDKPAEQSAATAS